MINLTTDWAEGQVYNPPSEDKGLVLRVTIGCSHNACSFCGMYRGLRFRARTFEELRPIILEAAEAQPNTRRVFLGDGNALALPTQELLIILNYLRQRFRSLERVSVAARATDILAKSRQELIHLQQAGLTLVYMGIESGDDQVLSLVRKGTTAAETIEAANCLHEVGMELSAMIILGLGGQKFSRLHIQNTASVLNQVQPDLLSIMSLMIRDNTPLAASVARGAFRPLSPLQILQELKNLVERMELERSCIVRTALSSGLFALAGTLPEDKELLLNDVDAAIRQETVTPSPVPVYRNVGIF